MRSVAFSAATVATVFGACLAGCGGSARLPGGHGSHTADRHANVYGAPFPRVKDDDLDADANSNDDSPIVSYGHAASNSEFRAIAALVKRYYQAAAAERGVEACAMLLRTFAEIVPEEDGTRFDPPYMRGKTCPVVARKLFKARHREIAAQLPGMKVTLVRVGASSALVVLKVSGTSEPQKITLGREDGAWRMKELLDSPMP